MFYRFLEDRLKTVLMFRVFSFVAILITVQNLTAAAFDPDNEDHVAEAIGAQSVKDFVAGVLYVENERAARINTARTEGQSAHTSEWQIMAEKLSNYLGNRHMPENLSLEKFGPSGSKLTKEMFTMKHFTCTGIHGAYKNPFNGQTLPADISSRINANYQYRGFTYVVQALDKPPKVIYTPELQCEHVQQVIRAIQNPGVDIPHFYSFDQWEGRYTFGNNQNATMLGHLNAILAAAGDNNSEISVSVDHRLKLLLDALLAIRSCYLAGQLYDNMRAGCSNGCLTNLYAALSGGVYPFFEAETKVSRLFEPYIRFDAQGDAPGFIPRGVQGVLVGERGYTSAVPLLRAGDLGYALLQGHGPQDYVYRVLQSELSYVQGLINDANGTQGNMIEYPLTTLPSIIRLKSVLTIMKSFLKYAPDNDFTENSSINTALGTETLSYKHAMWNAYIKITEMFGVRGRRFIETRPVLDQIPEETEALKKMMDIYYHPLHDAGAMNGPGLRGRRSLWYVLERYIRPYGSELRSHPIDSECRDWGLGSLNTSLRQVFGFSTLIEFKKHIAGCSAYWANEDDHINRGLDVLDAKIHPPEELQDLAVYLENARHTTPGSWGRLPSTFFTQADDTLEMLSIIHNNNSHTGPADPQLDAAAGVMMHMRKLFDMGHVLLRPLIQEGYAALFSHYIEENNASAVFNLLGQESWQNIIDLLESHSYDIATIEAKHIEQSRREFNALAQSPEFLQEIYEQARRELRRAERGLTEYSILWNETKQILEDHALASHLSRHDTDEGHVPPVISDEDIRAHMEENILQLRRRVQEIEQELLALRIVPVMHGDAYATVTADPQPDAAAADDDEPEAAGAPENIHEPTAEQRAQLCGNHGSAPANAARFFGKIFAPIRQALLKDLEIIIDWDNSLKKQAENHALQCKNSVMKFNEASRFVEGVKNGFIRS